MEPAFFTVGDLRRAIEGVDPNLAVKVRLQSMPMTFPGKVTIEEHIFSTIVLTKTSTHIEAQTSSFNITVSDEDFDLGGENEDLATFKLSGNDTH